MFEDSENLKNTGFFKSRVGGARKGAGRFLGGMNRTTKERKILEKEFRDRVCKNLNRLFNAQLTLAIGTNHLYKRVYVGKSHSTILVTDKEEIRRYLDGEIPDKSAYYFITTKQPDPKAIESLIDRGLGRPSQSIELEGGIEITPTTYDKLTDDELKKRITEALSRIITE